MLRKAALFPKCEFAPGCWGNSRPGQGRLSLFPCTAALCVDICAWCLASSDARKEKRSSRVVCRSVTTRCGWSWPWPARDTWSSAIRSAPACSAAARSLADSCSACSWRFSASTRIFSGQSASCNTVFTVSRTTSVPQPTTTTSP